MQTPTIHRFLPVCGLAAVLYCGTAASSQAAVSMSWSGGSGAPLTVTFAEPVVFDVTASDAAGTSPVFVMVGIGNLFASLHPAVSGLTFSVDGGSSQPINNFWNSGVTSGVLVSTDVYFFGALPPLTAGDIVTIHAGTLTGTTNFAGAAPTATSAEMFIINSISGAQVSSAGTSVPEPSSALLGGLGLLGLLRRRRS